MDKLKVLILGDGLLGSEIEKQTGWDCISRKKNNFSIDNFENLIPKNKYNVILNCIANTNTYSTDQKSHWEINYKFVHNLINFCNENNIKLIHISTDYLYTGSVNNASELDVPVHCNTWYGYTKLLSDGLVQLLSNNYLLIRCTHKPNPFPYNKAWVDQVGNFDYVNVISELIIKSINKGLKGLYNLGTDVKTMFELAIKTNNVSKEFSPLNVPKNTSMEISKLTSDLNNTKFFSIAIPTYGYNGKGSEFLEFSFEKLYSQTFKSFEIVISDHSTDNTIKDICDKWKDKLNIIHSFNEKGRGVISPNINESMKNCKGEWIKILFQDDFLFDENSLQKQYNYIKQTQNLIWFFTEFYHSNDGINFYRHYYPQWNSTVWSGNNTLGCPSGLTLKNNDLMFFDENLNWLMDCDFYQRMFFKYGEPSVLNEITVVNRTWGARLTDTISQSLKDKEFNILKLKYDRTS
jgi:dTDP-4-dehydrorhamnose reductase